MISFKTLNKDQSLNRTYGFSDLQNIILNSKECTMFKVWELVNNTYIYYGTFTIQGCTYKRLHTCARNWLRNNAIYDGINLI